MDHKTGFMAGDGDDEMSRKKDVCLQHFSSNEYQCI